MKTLLRAAHLLALSGLLAGCASYNMIKQPPAQPQPIALAISGEGPSGWSDLPIGVYRVPNTNVIISGHQSAAGTGIGMAFGLIGVLAADAIGTAAGARAVKNAEDALRVDLVPQATTDTQALLASGRFAQSFSLVTAADKPAMTVVPFTVISFVNDTDIQPYVILKTTLAGKSAKSGWTTRYIATVGKPMALTGDGSFTADGGALLKTSLNTALERAIGAMLDDVANRPVRDETKLIYVESGVPYTRMRVGMPGYALTEDDRSVVFAPKVADALVFAGVYVADKTVTTPRPATAEDKLKLVEEGK